MPCVCAAMFQPFQTVMTVADNIPMIERRAVLTHKPLLFLFCMGDEFARCFFRIMPRGKFRIAGRLGTVERNSAKIGMLMVLRCLGKMNVHFSQQ